MHDERSAYYLNNSSRFLTALLLPFTIALAPILVEANSTPVRLDRDPVFEITPLVDTPLVVARERLTFAVGSSSSEALVTASYQLLNPGNESLTVPMIFPAISESEPLFSPRITLNGEGLDYELFLAGSASVQNYFANPESFGAQVNVDFILSALSEPVYAPASFSPIDQAVLYEISLGGQVDRQSTLGFEFDAQKTKVLSFSHQGYTGSQSQSGWKVEFSRYVDQLTPGEAMSVLIIGEDNLTDVAVSSGDSLTKRAVTVEHYLKEQLRNAETQSPGLDSRNIDNLYSAILRELDGTWRQLASGFDAARPFDDVLNSVLSRNNISAFLFTAEFAPDSTNALIVSYPVRATIDRSSSNDYVNTFAYILGPAANFADFGVLDIEIDLNEHSPYILESSIPLKANGAGRYLATLEGLPEVDLVFSTYTKPEISLLDSLTASTTYPMLAFVIGAGLLLLITAILTLVRRLFGSAK